MTFSFAKVFDMPAAFLAGLILTLIPLPAAAVSVPLDLTGLRPGPITVTRAIVAGSREIVRSDVRKRRA